MTDGGGSSGCSTCIGIFKTGPIFAKSSGLVELWLYKWSIWNEFFDPSRDLAMANNFCCRWTQAASGAAGRANVGHCRASTPCSIKMETAYSWSWWRSTVVERRSLAGELSLSCARPAPDEWPLMRVNYLLQVSQLGQLSLSSFRGR